MKHRCLLVDDEPLALGILESYIQIIPTLEMAGKCCNAFDAMTILQQEQVDIMFLDIKMPQLKGNDFLRNIHHPPKVIFTTAHKEYALEGYDLEVVDYLLKPISLERFIKAIGKINGKRDDSKISDDNNNLPNKHFLYFKIDRKIVKVFLDEIVYVESERDYIKIIRENNTTPLLVKQTITSLEEMLPKNQFLRIHRSFIVSVAKIRSFNQQDVEVGDFEIPVGRGYQQSLKLLTSK